MKTWIFAGVCDKSELLLYICKLLASGGNRILLVDATKARKYSCMIGQFDKSLSLTEFSGFDVACGYSEFEQLKHELNPLDQYDYILYDVNIEGFIPPNLWCEASARIWVSDYELWTLEKGTEWLQDLVSRHKADGLKISEFQRVYIRTVDEWFDEVYLDAYFDKLSMIWKGEIIHIPWNELDLAQKLRNEHSRKLMMRPLTKGYKRNLCLLVQLLSEFDHQYIRRALKSAERRRA
ncbi:hypothetical protein [Paenibacillus pini]|uniref:Uncharacterized protein n=1 Tax=Paenibacillus pini JCM 16418 TaxID=1236976 RepID=W7YS85_9BACL|nr:hypothetical protein [Paenibacillus pini]GAF07536.1 hypothetical protein JCM16418_1554 [Paenibacillus pini JCM 16418]